MIGFGQKFSVGLKDVSPLLGRRVYCTGDPDLFYVMLFATSRAVQSGKYHGSEKNWGCKDGKRKTTWVSWDDLAMRKYMGGLGFWDTEIFNLVMFEKQGWRILQEPSSLSVRILKAKYVPSSDLLESKLGSQPSQVW